MPVFETFSKRQKLLQSQGKPVVYQYDTLPNSLRVQIVRILDRAIGAYIVEERFGALYDVSRSNALWRLIQQAMCDEMGVFTLTSKYDNPAEQCRGFILGFKATDQVIDIIQFAFRIIDRFVRERYDQYRLEAGVIQSPDDAIAELNHRFQEHGVGYQYVAGEIIRVDSQFLHAEVVEPALMLMSDAQYTAALGEFLKAHEYFRKRDNQDAMVWALKAFESTMKTICDAKGWQYDKSKATAKNLIQVILHNGLVKSYLQEQLTGLRIVLESGVPTVRNKTSGHGQGTAPIIVPDYLTAYVIHLAAANIVLLIEAYKSLP